MLAEEKQAIQLACQKGKPHTWSPSYELRVDRLSDGRVRVRVRDQNRAAYTAVYAYVQKLIQDGKAKDLRDKPHQELGYAFSFMPVR